MTKFLFYKRIKRAKISNIIKYKLIIVSKEYTSIHDIYS